MNALAPLFIVFAMLIVTVVLLKIGKIRHSHIVSEEVKDLMFPADLKRAFADVLKAKQESQAALERARGESSEHKAEDGAS